MLVSKLRSVESSSCEIWPELQALRPASSPFHPDFSKLKLGAVSDPTPELQVVAAVPLSKHLDFLSTHTREDNTVQIFISLHVSIQAF